MFRITTSLVNITVAGNGADFTVVVKPDEIDVNNMDGLVLVERVSGTEAINLISGQSAAIFSDGRPFQVSPMSPETYPTARFSVLTKEKTNVMLRHLPFNFVFCGVPAVYYFASIDYEAGKVDIVNLPPDLDVQEFVQGCTTLDQAFLYGGGVYVSTVMEQIMNTRVPKYTVVERNDLIRIAAVLGGARVDVDERAATEMKLKMGTQKLTSAQLTSYLRLGISSVEDAKNRQVKVMKAILEGLTSKNIVLTTLLSEEILSAMQTNISPSELMDQYSKFSTVQNWKFKEHILPVKRTYHAGRREADPILEECKTLLQKE
jgi:hypothetical protein